MHISPISTLTNFKGKVIVKNKISANQNYLFNLHKSKLEDMIKGMPFDLLVEQSKSKKTISVSTNIENASAYIVRKNKQNFEEVAGYAIEDSKKKSKIYQDMVKAQSMLDAGTNAFKCIAFGKFKLAREFEKEQAELAVKDFEVYKQIPRISITNLPKEVITKTLLNGFKYRIYKAFSKKTPEEKEFLKLKKGFLKELKAEHKEIKTVTIEFPRFYW